MRTLLRRTLPGCTLALTACAGAQDLAAAAKHTLGSGTTSTVRSVVESKEPKRAVDELMKRKARDYARDPTAAIRDAERIKADYDRVVGLLEKAVRRTWGDREVKLPEKKRYVKYENGYRNRTEVDYERGEITVETLEDRNSEAVLRDATVTALQTPDDPAAVDIFSDKPVDLRGDAKPVLAGVVEDERQRPVTTRADAEAYSTRVVRTQKKTRTIEVNGVRKKATYVKVKMPPNFQNRLAENYRPLVTRYAERFELDPTLVFAIMRTESNFNPYAVSPAPAYGLMQLVPKSGGRDGYRHAKGTDGIPTKEYLFDADNNIELGSAYLHVLSYKLLAQVEQDQSREYCVISAYNTGPANVFRSFARDERSALPIINGLEPPRVYDHLREKLPFEETRQYLARVTAFKKEFRAAEPPPSPPRTVPVEPPPGPEPAPPNFPPDA